ncbi:MAG: hypothetical protein U0J62_07645 [Lachnospiraceae bacterium]|nr:hypothetical protein [Lachnospiraceae bacterium]
MGQIFDFSGIEPLDENETDWLQMAKFHAHWSKKFYGVIVPYLR